jgi:D-amino-acid dehydrogenase
MSKVVVAGAGVIGLMCAYELRRSGFEVVLLDRSDPGSGCSSGNMGWIVPSFARPLPAPGLVRLSMRWMFDQSGPLHITLRPDVQLARWLWGFWRHCNARDYRAGLEALVHLASPVMAILDRARADGVEFEMHQSGVLFLFLSRAARDEVQRDLEFMARDGGPAPQALEPDEIRRLEPRVHDGVAAGILVGQERHVKPESLVAGLQRRLREMGVEIRAGINVTGVRVNGRIGAAGVEGFSTRARGAAADEQGSPASAKSAAALVSTAGEVAGDLFLLTTGAWSGLLADALGVSLPIQGGKGYSITIDRPTWQPAHAVYLDEARVAVSPFEGQVRIGGTMEFSGLDTGVNPRRLDAIRAAASRYLREWPAGEGETAWAGLRPLTPDGLPILGRLPGYDNVFVATGHGMLGITLAPSTALVMAQLLRTGVSDIDLTPFRPDRFSRSTS